MNIALWIVTCLLAVVFTLAGLLKLTRSKAQLITSQAWAESFPPGLIKLIGVCEIAGAIGLVVPAVTGVATWLVPTAAIGLVLLMAGAAITHLRRHEYPNIAANLVLRALAVFVVVQRFGPQSF
jgi:uncharacterized membrane protein YphA (DoxX/SURF4 family)